MIKIVGKSLKGVKRKYGIELITWLEGHSGIVYSVAFSPDGKLLASGSNDNRIGLWDVSNPQKPRLITWLERHSRSVYSIAFSPDGKLLASGSYKRIGIWDISNPQEPRLITWLEGQNSIILSIAFSPRRNLLASSSRDSRIGLWNISDSSTPRHIKRLGSHNNRVYSIAFSPDGKLLASGSKDTRIGIWDISNPGNPRRIRRLEGHTHPVYSVAFSPDGKLLASGSEDKRIGLWDISNPSEPRLITWLEGHSGSVRSVSFSPDGKLLASGNSGIGLWNLPYPFSIKPLKQLEGHRYRKFIEITWEIELEEKKKRMTAKEKHKKILELLELYEKDPGEALIKASEGGVIIDLLRDLVADRKIEQVDASTFEILHYAPMPRNAKVIEEKVDKKLLEENLEADIIDYVKGIKRVANLYAADVKEDYIKEALMNIFKRHILDRALSSEEADRRSP